MKQTHQPDDVWPTSFQEAVLMRLLRAARNDKA
jgi:hypothetical protein